MLIPGRVASHARGVPFNAQTGLVEHRSPAGSVASTRIPSSSTRREIWLEHTSSTDALEHPRVMRKKAVKLPGIQVGVAGEYLVAAELSRRGYVATLTLRNTWGIDILASNLDATKAVGIQVKTANERWQIG